jgi:hypothetical protein
MNLGWWFRDVLTCAPIFVVPLVLFVCTMVFLTWFCCFFFYNCFISFYAWTSPCDFPLEMMFFLCVGQFMACFYCYYSNGT